MYAPPQDKNKIEELNKFFINLSKKRAGLKTKWQQVFKESKITEKNMTSGMYEVIETEKTTVKFIGNKEPECGFFAFIYKMILKFKTRENLKRKYKIADAVLKTLCRAKIIKTPYSELKLEYFTTKEFTGCLTLLNCTTRERNIFINSIKEIYSKPEGQKYIIKKDDKYIMTPLVISSNKKYTEILLKYLEQELGYLDIIMTRTPNGWKELLKAEYNLYFDENLSENRIWL